MTFVQCWTIVEDVEPTLYKCYKKFCVCWDSVPICICRTCPPAKLSLTMNTTLFYVTKIVHINYSPPATIKQLIAKAVEMGIYRPICREILLWPFLIHVNKHIYELSQSITHKRFWNYRIQIENCVHRRAFTVSAVIQMFWKRFAKIRQTTVKHLQLYFEL